VIKKLREFHTAKELAEIYATPHDHAIYGRGHGIRVNTTIQLAKDMAYQAKAKSVADLSCGNGAIAKALGIEKMILGDFAKGYEYSGPLEANLRKIDNVDLYICSESIEHVEDPSSVLNLIRKKSQTLVLSTPIDAWYDTNEEHYWAWNRSDVETLLKNAGWTPDVFIMLDTTVFGEPYIYGMWGCK
jgi:2-polyprenyl-3-methyl-5-hydroxy-6-metoxy-1,4-benzoquinol methylase